MESYWDIIVRAYRNYANYLWNDVTHPQWRSYFYMLILISAFFFLLEVLIPWRKKQRVLRRDFFLDGFYMFFNFFLFSLIIYNAASDVVVNLFNNGIQSLTGVDLQAMNPLNTWPLWAILIVGFIVRDFVQWWTHRLLHRVDWLWSFHKVHHSVSEMGFAAHLRFHWMETVVYRTIEYIPLALLGIGLYDFFIIHLFTLAWGHYNHANISVSPRITGGVVGGLIGTALAVGAFDLNLLAGSAVWLKGLTVVGTTALGSVLLAPLMPRLFNSPEMHIWHHAHDLPADRRYGVNFGLTLAVWDYLFGTAYVPEEGRDIPLGFPGVEEFPDDFLGQVSSGFGRQ